MFVFVRIVSYLFPLDVQPTQMLAFFFTGYQQERERELDEHCLLRKDLLSAALAFVFFLWFFYCLFSNFSNRRTSVHLCY